MKYHIKNHAKYLGLTKDNKYYMVTMSKKEQYEIQKNVLDIKL